MVACPLRTMVVLYRMFTFIMCLIWLIFRTLFITLSTSLGCFRRRIFFFNNGLDNSEWASFISNLHDKSAGEFHNSKLFLLAAFGATEEPLVSCMMVHFCFQILQFVFNFEKVDRILVICMLSISCLSLCLHYTIFACYASSLYFYSEITYFYIKLSALTNFIDVVSNLSYLS